LLDPQTGVWFENQLTDIREEVLLDQIPPRNGFLYLPQDTSVAAWAENYEHRMYEPIGIAQFIADFAEDLPLVDIATRKETFNLRTFGVAYQYNIDEIEKSKAVGMDLQGKRARAARLVTEQKFNDIMFFGDPETQLFGLVNYPYIPRRLLPYKIEEATAAQDILDMFHDLVNSIFTLTETIGDPDTVGLPPTQYAHIASRRIGDGTDTKILQDFLAASPFIKEVVPMRELAGAGPNGEDLVVVYRNDSQIIEHKLAREFTQLAPQRRNLAVLTNCHAKSGGMASDRPLEMVIGELPQ
jgi:hypothetical protein